MSHTFTIPFGKEDAIIEIGKVARQANGACTVRVGETVVLVASVMAPSEREGIDFFPLMVDYREKFYSSGRIPGGFFKREGRPGDQETLKARLIDRTLRPLFPEGFKNEVQVYVTILSSDGENLPELAAMLGASISLHISDIPLQQPIAGARIGLIDGEFVLNPSLDEKDASDLDLIVAGHADAINMVECGANELPEDKLIEALEFAHKNIKIMVDAQEKIRAEIGVEKFEFVPPEVDEELKAKVANLAESHWEGIYAETGKAEKEAKVNEAQDAVIEALGEDFEERVGEVKGFFHDLYKQKMRQRVVNEGIRADGRGTTDIRPLSSETRVLPRTHGSGLFTRGQTQVLSIITLGSVGDQQMIDDIYGVTHKDFMLHYNFPSFSVGECRMPRGPGRREIGHGMLAERALRPMLPTQDEFPYTIRIVAEVLESNGSSSMATVCSSCLGLLDAGVPMEKHVGGVAMGLIKEGDKIAVLTDILGSEDHYGDMDFKVTGTVDGVTALQMDIKISGVSREVLASALEQAREARLAIIEHMKETIAAPAEMSPYSPRINVIQIDPAKIREVIGSGGRVINGIIESTGVQIDINDDGRVYICSPDAEGVKKATAIVEMITKELQVGEVYDGKVVRVADFGAIVEIAPGKDGMLHISELEWTRVEKTEDVVKEGDTVQVKVVEVDKDQGRVRFSRKALLPKPEGYVEREERPRRPNGGGDRRGRDGGRGNRGSRDGNRGSRDGGRRPSNR